MPINSVDELELSLQQWARWVMKQHVLKRECPNFSAHSSPLPEGNFPHEVSPCHCLHQATAEVMNHLLHELADYKPLLVEVIKVEYLTDGRQHRKAQQLGLTLSHYKAYRGLAKRWLWGRLTATCKNVLHSTE